MGVLATVVAATQLSAEPIHPDLDLTSHTIFRLIVLQNFITRPFTAAIGKAHGLSLTEWRVLFIAGARPGVTASEMVEDFGFEKMAVSRAIARLADIGRLTRHAEPNDRRRVRLMLTPEGEALLTQLSPQAMQRETLLEAALTPAERRTLDRLIEKLTEAVRAGH